MAFLDWPLSNGSLNPEGWLDDPDQRAEHSHRLLAMLMGLISIVIVFWTHLKERRPWVRKLSVGLLAMVIFQGLIGGLRVRLDRLNIQADHNLIAQTFAVLHAISAQLVIILLVSLSLATSRFWIEKKAGLSAPVTAASRSWGVAALLALLIQVLLGAVMRHGHAALAIPTFPLTPEGGLVPRIWNFGVAIHFAHRAWAGVVTLILMIFLSKLWGRANTRKALGGLALGVTFLLALQIYLGALTIWTVKSPHAATAHTVVGYGLVAGTYALTFLSFRLSSWFSEPGKNNVVSLSTHPVSTS